MLWLVEDDSMWIAPLVELNPEWRKAPECLAKQRSLPRVVERALILLRAAE